MALQCRSCNLNINKNGRNEQTPRIHQLYFILKIIAFHLNWQYISIYSIFNEPFSRMATAGAGGDATAAVAVQDLCVGIVLCSGQF